MKKIKVLHCVGQLGLGGAETLIVNVMKHIDKEKFQFDFLVFHKQAGFYDEEVKKMKGNIYDLASLSEVGIIKYIQNLVKFFKEYEPDVVHSHMDWLGGFISLAAKQAGVQNIIVHAHADQSMFEKGIITKMLININKVLIKHNADYCLACSNQAGLSLFKSYFHVVLNGIETKRYVSIEKKNIMKLKKEFHIEDHEVLLGSVGSLTKNKNQQFIIEIMRELQQSSKNYKCIIVGRGDELQSLKEKVEKYGLHEYVIFTGVRKDIPEFMNMFDIFLLPSLHEGLGIVAIEAQVSSTPCIVSNTIPKEIIVDEKLVHFLPLEIHTWVKKIKEIEVSKKYQCMNYSAYDIEATCAQLVKVYCQAIGEQ